MYHVVKMQLTLGVKHVQRRAKKKKNRKNYAKCHANRIPKWYYVNAAVGLVPSEY